MAAYHVSEKKKKKERKIGTTKMEAKEEMFWGTLLLLPFKINGVFLNWATQVFRVLLKDTFVSSSV